MKRWTVSLGVTLAMLGLLAAVRSAVAQGPEPRSEVSVAAVVGSKISYQGVLREGGVPVTGARDMTFRFYSNDTCTAQVNSVSVAGVPVSDGLFAVDLTVTHGTFDGRALWIGVEVGGTVIGCEEVVPVPYALSVRPGAEVQGVPNAPNGWVISARMNGTYPLASAVYGNAATGFAVRGDSQGGRGINGYTDDGYAVYGYDGGSATARGYGGYFESINGVGVYGYSSAPSYYTNMYAPGVYGRSANGAGVYGKSDASHWPAYGGYFEGRAGVGASSTGTSTQDGYAGTFTSANYRGLYVISQAGYYDAYFAGTGGVYVSDGLWVGGDLNVSGSKAGYTVDIAVNDGPEPLELGDVVILTGAAEPVLGEIPVARIAKADVANSTAVMGVVDRAYLPPAAQVEAQELGGESAGRFVSPSTVSAAGTGIAQGEYVGVVTLGAFRAIKVDASYGPIQPGDLLVSSPTPGHAMVAEDPKMGTVIGKAMEGLEKGTGVIPVLVTLQ